MHVVFEDTKTAKLIGRVLFNEKQNRWSINGVNGSGEAVSVLLLD